MSHEDPKRPGHYGGPGDVIDPRTYGKMHGLDFDEISVIKYVTRWREASGLRDIDKAIHYLELLRKEAVDIEIGKLRGVDRAVAHAPPLCVDLDNGAPDPADPPEVVPVPVRVTMHAPPNYGNSDPGLRNVRSATTREDREADVAMSF